MTGMAKEFTPTHLDKVYWPGAGYTKADLIDYYDKIAPFMLPYLKDRPVVMKRFPDGIRRQSFFQKNVVDEHMPKFVKMARIPAKTIAKDVHYVVANNAETLSYLANLGAIELHPWCSRVRSLNKPDFMIFDLDPGEKTSFKDVIEAAHALKGILDGLGIQSHPKTSGQSGLHVYVPLAAKYPYEKVRDFAHQVARILVDRHPKLASLEKHPRDRKDKIFIDYLRNAFGQTAIAPYCPRATATATVSTPLEWSEVRSGLSPQGFTIKTIFRRLQKKGDLWKPVIGKGMDLEKGLKNLAK